jgi:hypothetical protein
MPEKYAIVICCLVIAVITIPILVVMQTLSTLFWSGVMVVALMRGKGLLDDEDGFFN